MSELSKAGREAPKPANVAQSDVPVEERWDDVFSAYCKASRVPGEARHFCAGAFNQGLRWPAKQEAQRITTLEAEAKGLRERVAELNIERDEMKLAFEGFIRDRHHNVDMSNEEVEEIISEWKAAAEDVKDVA
jgi:hypothetical protein